MEAYRIAHRPTLVPIAALAASLALAAAAHADTTITTRPAASVSAYGGAVAWTERLNPTRYRLMITANNFTASLPIATLKDAGSIPPSVDLGPRGGSILAVYPRCARSDDSSSCNIYEALLSGGGERKKTSISLSSVGEADPSQWEGNYAFSRDGEVFGRRGQNRRLQKRADPNGTDISGKIVAYTRAFDSIWVQRLETNGVGGACRVRSTDIKQGEEPQGVAGPVIDGDYVYWGEREFASNGGTSKLDLYRIRLPAGDCRARGPLEHSSRVVPGGFGEIAVDGGAVYLAAATGVLRLEPNGF